tara:strand:+ start:939 stop:1241 length:303 start_codon:yes stop_codon:yes gene_type:complete
MHIYVCLETILKNDNIIPLIKEYYQSGNHITIACTKLFRSTNTQKDIIEKMLEPLNGYYHVLSFLKPEYDKIIDNKTIDINANQHVTTNEQSPPPINLKQ